MDARLATFVLRHSETQDQRLAIAISAARSGSVVLRSLSEDVSSSHLARVYALRSAMAKDQKRYIIATEMLSLSEECKANEANPCAIWVLEGSPNSFAVFELLPSYKVAGCLCFEGPFTTEQDGA